MPVDNDTTKVMRRLLRRINEASGRYVSVGMDTIKEAMVSAFREYLEIAFGNNLIFDVYWESGEKLRIKNINIATGEENDFNINRLGEKRIRDILNYFNLFLDNAEATEDYKKLKYLRGGMVYAKTIRYENEIATVSFFDNNGTERFGFCRKRDLLPRERNAEILKNAGIQPFMVKKINYSFHKTRCDLILSRTSLHLPEALLSETLQENSCNLADYRFCCVRRIGGIISLVVSVGLIPKYIMVEAQSKLRPEYLRIFSIKPNSNEGKAILSGEKTWESVISKYFNISTLKRLKRKSGENKLMETTKTNYSKDSFLGRLLKGGN